MHDETWRIDSSSSGGFRLLNHWWFIAYLEIKTIRIRGPWVQQDWDFDPSARAFSQIPCVPSWLLQEQPTLGRVFFHRPCRACPGQPGRHMALLHRSFYSSTTTASARSGRSTTYQLVLAGEGLWGAAKAKRAFEGRRYGWTGARSADAPAALCSQVSSHTLQQNVAAGLMHPLWFRRCHIIFADARAKLIIGTVRATQAIGVPKK